MDRRIITVIIYAAIIVILPQQVWFVELTNPLYAMDRMLVLVINIVGLAIGVGGMWAMPRYTRDFIVTKPRLADIVYQGFSGLMFAGIITVIEYFANMAISIVWLFVIPLATMVADALYQMFAWRLSKREED